MGANERVESTTQSTVSPEEWEMRVNLAACYRLAAQFRWTDLIYTHISARVPGGQHHFLINAYGLLWNEITASSLVKVALDGTVLSDPTGYGINPAGYLIHSAIHGAREDVVCVMHTHSRAGVAVSAQRDGLLPISQHAMRFTDKLGYHDYEGIVLDADEQVRLIANLGMREGLVLRNHGLLTTGRSIREAFDRMYYLEMACQIQIDALAGGMPVVTPPRPVQERVARQFDRPNRDATQRDWPAMLRMLDKIDPSYRT
jgi:ribulose-5-phosphate 4-epimerase/fuculose-1-phosphate aldolase